MLAELRAVLFDDVERCAVLSSLDRPGVPVPCAAWPDRCQVAVSGVLRLVLTAGWSHFVLVHTHPRGGPPGPADHAFTRRLVAASAVVGVRLDGHVVLAPGGTYVVSGSARPEAASGVRSSAA